MGFIPKVKFISDSLESREQGIPVELEAKQA